MLKSGETVVVRWNSMNKNHYENKGYIYTGKGKELIVKVEDLQPSARVKVKIICDYCNEEVEMFMYAYTRSTKHRDKIACNRCKNKKTQETLMTDYGVSNVTLIPEVREKQMKTLVERYGVTLPCYLPQHKEAMKFYDKELAQKNYIKTCQDRYGIDNTGKLQTSIEKAKRTCMERYGGESSQCDIEVHKKTIDTLINKDGIPSSRPEKEMVQLLKELYGEENCHSQYNFGKCAFDCLLEVKGIQIDVEYDGNYWHKNRSNQDRNRDFYVMRQGIKVLRFKGDTKAPTKEQIKDGVDYLVNSEHKHLIIDI